MLKDYNGGHWTAVCCHVLHHLSLATITTESESVQWTLSSRILLSTTHIEGREVASLSKWTPLHDCIDSELLAQSQRIVPCGRIESLEPGDRMARIW